MNLDEAIERFRAIDEDARSYWKSTNRAERRGAAGEAYGRGEDSREDHKRRRGEKTRGEKVKPDRRKKEQPGWGRGLSFSGEIGKPTAAAGQITKYSIKLDRAARKRKEQG